MSPPRAVVIGGGIAGLACAYRLRQLGVECLLLESADRPGGLIGSLEKDGFLFESGPQSFQATPAVLSLIRELGIENELCRADPRAPRFILRGGRLHKIPISPQALLTSSLLSGPSRWRILSEPMRRTRPPNEEESLAAFVRRKFGHEILEYLAAPFVSGVYAGDPEKLSLRAAFPTLEEWERQHGSILRGAMKSRGARRGESSENQAPPLCSFHHGVAGLPRAIAEKLGDSLRAGACAYVVNRADAASPAYEIHASIAGKNHAIAAQAVIFATPAYIASRLIAGVSPAAAHALSGVAYAPACVVAAGYYSRQFGRSLGGFGVLIPRSEKYRTLGTVWNSSLFPGRAPAGGAAITSFIGGATDPEILAQPEDAIASIVERENASILEVTGAPVTSMVWKHPKALPQYNLGHAHIVEAIRDAEGAAPGLFFSGNYLEGPSIGKCVEQAFKTAQAVRNFLPNS